MKPKDMHNKANLCQEDVSEVRKKETETQK